MAGLLSSAYLRPEAARRQRERNCLQGPEEKNVAAFLAKSECFACVCICCFPQPLLRSQPYTSVLHFVAVFDSSFHGSRAS